MNLTLAIFVLVYLAMGVGQLPGFRPDRTGAALVGAMLLLALGEISPAVAWQSIDYNAIGLRSGLMIISSHSALPVSTTGRPEGSARRGSPRRRCSPSWSWSRAASRHC